MALRNRLTIISSALKRSLIANDTSELEQAALDGTCYATNHGCGFPVLLGPQQLLPPSFQHNWPQCFAVLSHDDVPVSEVHALVSIALRMHLNGQLTAEAAVARGPTDHVREAPNAGSCTS